MQKWVCGVLVFVLLLTFSYIPPLKSADAVSFSDVSSNYWAVSEISDLAGKGVLSGYPDGTFKPDTNVTRAEFAKIIGLAMSYSPNPSASQKFPDVARDHWAFGYIASAVDHGLVKGYPDGTFGPSKNVTKAEILTIIARAQNWSGGSGSHFNDVPSDYWAFGNIESCFANGIVKNPDPNIVSFGNLGPDAPANRAQTCVFTDRMLVSSDQPTPSPTASQPTPSPTASTGVWKHLPFYEGDDGGVQVTCLILNPNRPQVLWAGVRDEGIINGEQDCGVIFSPDGGATWSSSSGWPTNDWASCLAIDPTKHSQILYAGANYSFGGSDGLFKTTNGGANWSSFSNGLTNSTVWCLAIDPTNPQILYAGTYGDGVFKSTNGGDSWVASSNGLDNIVQCLAIDPTNPQILYAGTYLGGVCKSINGGTSWAASSSGLDIIQCLAIDPSDSQTLYAGTHNIGAFKSTNGGGSWVASSNGMESFVQCLAIDPTNPQILYAGTYGDGVFKSSNGGASWSGFSRGLTNGNVQYLAIDPSGILYAGTKDGGIFRIVL